MRFIILAALLALAAAQTNPLLSSNIPTLIPRAYFTQYSTNATACRTGQSLDSSKANYYNMGSGVVTTICVGSYETACATPIGVVACNSHDAICRSSSRLNDMDVNPTIYANIANSAQECISDGAYEHPEAQIIGAAQATTSFVVFIIASILGFIPVRGRISVGVIIAYWSLIITSIVLLVSYYYLNAFIAVSVGLIAINTFATKDHNAITIGLLSLVSALVWFTFDGGLGYIQHHARYRQTNAQDPSNPFYEELCNNYYRYSYKTDLWTARDDINQGLDGFAMCLRNWLAAEYYFITLVKLLIAYLVAAGASQLHPQEEKKEETQQ